MAHNKRGYATVADMNYVHLRYRNDAGSWPGLSNLLDQDQNVTMVTVTVRLGLRLSDPCNTRHSFLSGFQFASLRIGHLPKLEERLHQSTRGSLVLLILKLIRRYCRLNVQPYRLCHVDSLDQRHWARRRQERARHAGPHDVTMTTFPSSNVHSVNAPSLSGPVRKQMSEPLRTCPS